MQKRAVYLFAIKKRTLPPFRAVKKVLYYTLYYIGKRQFAIIAFRRQTMKREKSCGAIVFKYENGRLMILTLRHKHGGHWSFPKGHVENGETEVQTALREVKEETDLDIELLQGFRHTVEYSPKPGVKKLVVYFLGRAGANAVAVKQEAEIGELKWVEWDEAFRIVSFKNDRELLSEVREMLMTESVVS